MNNTCHKPSIGRVDIWIGVRNVTMKSKYGVALQTVKCYAQRMNYHLHIVDITNDELVVQRCSEFSDYVCYLFVLFLIIIIVYRLYSSDVIVHCQCTCRNIIKQNGG